MNYTQNACCEGACAETLTARESTLTEMQQKARSMAEEILKMTHRLSMHFFGINNREPEENQSLPDCFRNDLYLEVQALHATMDELMRMINEIGA